MGNKQVKDLISGRVWAFVLYPESCIEYVKMIEKLRCLGVPMAISPLHLPEKNKKQENEKKPHYHCMMYFDGAKKLNSLKKLIDMSSSSYDKQYFEWYDLGYKGGEDFAKYPHFIKVNSIRQYFRYLIHLDDEDKQQFSDYKILNFVNDDELKYNTIVLLNGFNEKDYLKSSAKNPDFDILEIVDENEFKSINELMHYLVHNKNLYLLDYIKKNMNYISRFLLADLFLYGRGMRKE